MQNEISPFDGLISMMKVVEDLKADICKPAQDIWDKGYNRGLAAAVRLVKMQSTIDAVPVVRCKECKHRGSSYSCPMRKLVMPFSGPGAFEDCTEDEGYCHLGEKMGRGAESGCEQSST